MQIFIHFFAEGGLSSSPDPEQLPGGSQKPDVRGWGRQHNEGSRRRLFYLENTSDKGVSRLEAAPKKPFWTMSGSSSLMGCFVQ